eukprot:9493548-Pyramimonas_sp.AAC.1
MVLLRRHFLHQFWIAAESARRPSVNRAGRSGIAKSSVPAAWGCGGSRVTPTSPSSLSVCRLGGIPG